MKSILFAILITFIGHTEVFSQTFNHPTIDKVQVTYKMIPVIPSSNTSTNKGTPEINVMPNVVITLKSSVDASKLFLKIVDKQTQAVIYQVNYMINSANVTSSSGFVLFKKENNVLSIGSPDIIPLKPYVYELYTENTQGTTTNLYSITQ